MSKNKIRPTDTCHNDPNLLTGQFGQVGAAQTHLENNKVGIGDLFLFWGWFRETKKIKNKILFDKRDPGHYRLFGWFQIGKVIELRENQIGIYLKNQTQIHTHIQLVNGQKIIPYTSQNQNWKALV